MNPIANYIKSKLRDFYTDGELASIIKIILTEIFHFSTIELYCGKDRSFSDKEMGELNLIIDKLKEYEPIQYIIGKERFHNLDFKVTKDVLIPRPETAELVDWIVEECSTGYRDILDIGTGSGCIAITLAANIDNVNVEAWDISAGALDIAKENAGINSVDVTFKCVDVLSFVPNGEVFDVIVSNPPYITHEEKSEMEKNVLDWEPNLALFVDNDDPLLFYRRIARIGRSILSEKGKLFFEINRAFAAQMITMLNEEGYSDVLLREDAFGNARMIRAIK